MTDNLVKRLREVPSDGTATLDNHNYWIRVGAITHEAADRIEALEAWLEQRDAFIVSKDLWHEFVSTMPMKTKPIMKDGRITGYVADFSDFWGKLTGKKKDG